MTNNAPNYLIYQIYFAIIENGDGKLSIEEVLDNAKSNGQPAPPKHFVAMLHKHAGEDGKLDKAEFKKLLQQMHAPPPKAPEAPKAPAAPKCQPPSEDRNATPQQRIDNLWEVVVCEADSKYKT